jgi:hypothetical protein
MEERGTFFFFLFFFFFRLKTHQNLNKERYKTLRIQLLSLTLFVCYY